MSIKHHLDMPAIEAFCRKWRIVELSLFGSAVRDELRPDSDVDLLVSFEENAPWSLLDHTQMEQELGELLGRRVDLVSRRGIERSRNHVRRQTILETAEPIYRAA